jgi:hypothetical protein
LLGKTALGKTTGEMTLGKTTLGEPALYHSNAAEVVKAAVLGLALVLKTLFRN